MENLSALGEVLGDLIGQHRQLIELGQQKKTAIIKGNLDDLTSVVQEESSVIREISQLESERQKTIALFLKNRNIRDEEITMSQLIEMVDNQQQMEMLQAVQDELTSVMIELRDLNKLNRQLIEQSLDFVNHSLELMTEEGPSITYGKPTQQTEEQKGKKKSGGNIFDTKA